MALPVMLCLDVPCCRGLMCYRRNSSMARRIGKPLCFNGFQRGEAPVIFCKAPVALLHLVVAGQLTYQIGQMRQVCHLVKPAVVLRRIGPLQRPSHRMRHMHAPPACSQHRQYIGL